jgi:hypothetical protein
MVVAFAAIGVKAAASVNEARIVLNRVIDLFIVMAPIMSPPRGEDVGKTEQQAGLFSLLRQKYFDARRE